MGIDLGTLSGRAAIIDIEKGEEMATSVLEFSHGVMSEKIVNGEFLPAIMRSDIRRIILAPFILSLRTVLISREFTPPI